MPNTHTIIGDGPHKVISLHGWFGHANGWGPLPEHLDRQQYSYAFMDCRGYGGMVGQGGPYTMEQVAEDAIQLADDLGWERFSLMGHSMCGVAIQLAWLSAPQRIRALIAITPVSAAGVPFDEQGWQLFSSAGENPDARRTIIDLTTGNRLTGIWLDAMVANTRRHADDEAITNYVLSWSKADFVDRLAGSQPPVLVLPGEHDPALGEDACRATWMEHYPQAQLEVVHNAGHYPMDEAPIILATRIEAFLAQVAA